MEQTSNGEMSSLLPRLVFWLTAVVSHTPGRQRLDAAIGYCNSSPLNTAIVKAVAVQDNLAAEPLLMLPCNSHLGLDDVD